MTRSDRWSLFARYAPGLTPLVVLYLVVTILRSIRADFAPEIWQALGEPAEPGTFTRSEVVVALGILAANGGSVLWRDNVKAFFASLATCGGVAGPERSVAPLRILDIRRHVRLPLHGIGRTGSVFVLSNPH